MTLDEILSQVAGGFNLQALSLDNILRAVLVLAVGVVVIKLIQRAVERILSRNTALAPIHRYLALSVVLWLLLALVLLGSMGVELTSIIALLSVAGLAVSLALQNTLSNLAGGIMLLVSKPFTIGDYVEIGSVSPWRTRRSTSPTASSPPPPSSTTPAWASGAWRLPSAPPTRTRRRM